MLIKAEKQSLLLEGVKSKANVTITDKISIQLTNPDVLIDMPGEYEYGDVGITAIEEDVKLTGKINLAIVEIEGIFIGIPQEVEFNKEKLKDISNVDILIITKDLSLETAKKFINYFEPAHVLVIGEFDQERLKKELSVSLVGEDKSFKIKFSDINRAEVENYQPNVVVIKA